MPRTSSGFDEKETTLRGRKEGCGDQIDDEKALVNEFGPPLQLQDQKRADKIINAHMPPNIIKDPNGVMVMVRGTASR